MELSTLRHLIPFLQIPLNSYNFLYFPQNSYFFLRDFPSPLPFHEKNHFPKTLEIQKKYFGEGLHIRIRRHAPTVPSTKEKKSLERSSKLDYFSKILVEQRDLKDESTSFSEKHSNQWVGGKG